MIRSSVETEQDALRLLAVCNYPCAARPAHQTFVRSTLRGMADRGAEVTVVAPESLWNLVKPRSRFSLAPRFERRDGVAVCRPRYVSWSNVKLPIGAAAADLTVRGHARTVLRHARRLDGTFDLCLAHFLYPHGFAAARLAEFLGVPAVVSLGESSFRRYESRFGRDEIRELLSRFVGIIANSPLLRQRCVERYDVPADRIREFPNGVDRHSFEPQDRLAARRRCGLPEDRPIVAFVGQYIERKGPNRVLDAISSRPEFGAVFLGYGPQVPQGEQVLFQGEVPHDRVPDWLSAADVFVLPTLDEGCCNALLEAMACGLPCVTSDRPFNRAVVDDDTAVLVDPQDSAALRDAVVSLLDDPQRREAMGRAALARAQSYSLDERTDRILDHLRALARAEQ